MRSIAYNTTLPTSVKVTSKMMNRTSSKVAPALRRNGYLSVESPLVRPVNHIAILLYRVEICRAEASALT